MIVFLVEHVNQNARLEQSLWVMITIKSMLTSVSLVEHVQVYARLTLRKKHNHHKKDPKTVLKDGFFMPHESPYPFAHPIHLPEHFPEIGNQNIPLPF